MRAERRAVDVHVSLLERRDIAGQIHRQLRRLILDGDLRPGDPLPPTRDLAAQLQVSRTTVLVAYDRSPARGSCGRGPAPARS